MSSFIGLVSFIIGWALTAFGTWATVLYGVIQMFRDGFMIGFLIAVLGPIACWAIGLLLLGSGKALMDA